MLTFKSPDVNILKFKSPTSRYFEMEIIKKGGVGIHMGRYGLILGANESYTNDIAIGINVDPLLGAIKI